MGGIAMRRAVMLAALLVVFTGCGPFDRGPAALEAVWMVRAEQAGELGGAAVVGETVVSFGPDTVEARALPTGRLIWEADLELRDDRLCAAAVGREGDYATLSHGWNGFCTDALVVDLSDGTVTDRAALNPLGFTWNAAGFRVAERLLALGGSHYVIDDGGGTWRRDEEGKLVEGADAAFLPGEWSVAPDPDGERALFLYRVAGPPDRFVVARWRPGAKERDWRVDLAELIDGLDAPRDARWDLVPDGGGLLAMSASNGRRGLVEIDTETGAAGRFVELPDHTEDIRRLGATVLVTTGDGRIARIGLDGRQRWSTTAARLTDVGAEASLRTAVLLGDRQAGVTVRDGDDLIVVVVDLAEGERVAHWRLPAELSEGLRDHPQVHPVADGLVIARRSGGDAPAGEHSEIGYFRLR